MICIVDYGMGNVGSIVNMFRRLGIRAVRSSAPAEIEKADRIIIPGVGSFDQGMKALSERGLREVLDRSVIRDRKPLLGICLGMQLLGRSSEEGSEKGLGWIQAQAKRFVPVPETDGRRAKVPHMGWNYALPARSHPLFADTKGDSRFYFVHSYRVVCDVTDDVLATTWYGGGAFASIVGRDHIVGVQFHPEKSHRFGMQILKNFASWTPAATEGVSPA